MTRNPVKDGEQFTTVYWSGMVNAHAAEAVLTGCAPSKGTGSWDVDVASGTVRLGTSPASVSAQTKTLTTPANDTDLDSGEFRVDLITIDSTGTAIVTEGTAATNPIAPDIPSSEVLITAVLVDGSATSLSASDIKDYRILHQTGISFNQTNEPTYVESATWIDPGSGILQVGYDAGNGGDYHPIPPVQRLDEASTFTESGVTVTTTDTAIVNGSVELQDELPLQDFEDGNKTIEESTWSYDEISGSASVANSTTMYGSNHLLNTASNASNTFRYSPDATPKSTSIKASIWIGSDVANDFDEVHFRAFTGGGKMMELEFEDSTNIIRAVHGDGAGSSTTTDIGTWTTQTIYDIDVQPNWSTLEFTLVLNGTNEGTFNFLPQADGSGLDKFFLENDTNSSGATRDMRWDNVEAVGNSTSGDVLVEWGAPSDIESWDLATFQRTLANETVTVDVEDGSNNVLHSDISENFDISTVADSTNVQIRASLSRANTANNPTLDYAARRYVR